MGWGQLLSAILAIAGGVAAVLITQHFTGRRWRVEQQERLWTDALSMARVVADAQESDLARSIARMRLDSLGIDQAWLERQRPSEGQSLADQVFSGSSGASHEADIEVVEQALSTSPTIDPDLAKVASALRIVDAAFARARAEDLPEEDTKVRIFLILVTFVAVFFCLAAAATFSALF